MSLRPYLSHAGSFALGAGLAFLVCPSFIESASALGWSLFAAGAVLRVATFQTRRQRKQRAADLFHDPLKRAEPGPAAVS